MTAAALFGRTSASSSPLTAAPSAAFSRSERQQGACIITTNCLRCFLGTVLNVRAIATTFSPVQLHRDGCQQSTWLAAQHKCQFAQSLSQINVHNFYDWDTLLRECECLSGMARVVGGWFSAQDLSLRCAHCSNFGPRTVHAVDTAIRNDEHRRMAPRGGQTKPAEVTPHEDHERTTCYASHISIGQRLYCRSLDRQVYCNTSCVYYKHLNTATYCSPCSSPFRPMYHTGHTDMRIALLRNLGRIASLLPMNPGTADQ